MPRKQAPSRYGNGPHPQKRRKDGKPNYFAELMKTPEGRELRRQWSAKAKGKSGRPRGVPDGYRKEMIKPIRDQAKKDAKRIVQIMTEKYNIEDQYAVEALETAVEIMRVPGETQQRVNAARLVLDFCKQKPVAKSEVTVTAEDFLARLAEEDGSESQAD